MSLTAAILATALLFGGVTLYSFGMAPLLFSALPQKTAGEVLRKAFSWFYLFVLVIAATGAMCWWPSDTFSAAVMATIAITTFPLRQVLMPAINRATDMGLKSRFKWLHGLSVLATLVHIGASGWLLARIT